MNYNIHDLLKIKIIGSTEFNSRDKLKYSFFETPDEVNNPDIILNIGKFKPSNNRSEVIAHKFHIGDGYFHCNNKGRRAKWELEIFGFGKENTVINFYGKGQKITDILFPSFLAQEFLIPIIEHKLAKKGHFLIHSGAVSKDNKAFIFSGRPGAYKTSLIMDLIRRRNFCYLSDDRVIIDKDGILCFPISSFLFEFMLNNMPTENRTLSDNIKLFRNIIFNIDSNKLNITRSAKLGSIFFVSKTNKENLSGNKIDLKVGIFKLCKNNEAEYISSSPATPYSLFYKYVLIYSLIYPHNDMINYQKLLSDNLGEIFKRTPMYEIELPNKYNLKTFNKICEYTKGV